jgi:hypothetical protein
LGYRSRDRTCTGAAQEGNFQRPRVNEFTGFTPSRVRGNTTRHEGEGEGFDPEGRNERWLKVSIGLGRFEQHMWPLVLQLGRLDTRLIQADGTGPERFFQANLSYEDSTTLHEHITLSYLWVLGVYEFIRTLCDRVSAEDLEKTPADVRTILLATKDRFARVRMPLAKMEPASKYSSEDSPIAYPCKVAGICEIWHSETE